MHISNMVTNNRSSRSLWTLTPTFFSFVFIHLFILDLAHSRDRSDRQIRYKFVFFSTKKKTYFQRDMGIKIYSKT